MGRPGKLLLSGDGILPRIGLLSDSHGRASTTQHAVDELIRQEVELLIHLGDVGTVEVVDCLVTPRPGDESPLPSRLVFGNVDWDAESLARYADGLGVSVDDPIGSLKLDHGELAFTHGHDASLMEEALARGVRWLCHGHSHRMMDEKRGRTRVVNPGALFRATSYTVAVLDTGTDDLQFLTVGGK